MYVRPTSYSFDFEFKDVLVQALISSKKLANCDLIASDKGLSNIIKSTTVMDVEDIGPWLHEGDAVIISRFMTSCFTETFINMLYDKKISCIITQKKFRKYITRENCELLIACNLPVILVEDHTSWSDVIVAIQGLIIKCQTQYVVENQIFQSSIIDYLSGEHALSSLCEIVQNLTGISIAIADLNMHIVDKSIDDDWNVQLQNLSNAALANYGTVGENFNNIAMKGYVYEDKLLENARKYFIIPSHISTPAANFYIVLKSKENSSYLLPQTVCRLETLISIYSLKCSIAADLIKSNHYFETAIFEGMLEMTKADQFKRNQISLSLNAELKNRYFLVLVKNSKNGQICKNVDLLTGFIDYLKHTEFYNKNILIFIYKEQWVFLFDDSVQSIKKTSTELYKLLIKYFASALFTMGVSNATYYWNLKQAYKEADFSINYLEKNQNSAILLYDELGILKLFSDESANINNLYIDELFRNYFAPLLAYDKEHLSELLSTLISLFSNDMSYKSTSKNLSIHVNTLRARISKIEEILSIDLKHLDNVLTLRLVTLLFQFDYFAKNLK